jgi:Spy/CpxP family protein refolding chaperone
MADTPHDHGASAELSALPLARPMFSRYFRMSEELGLTQDQFAELRAVLRSFFAQMYERHTEIIEAKNELRQVIVDLGDSRVEDWGAIHQAVDRIYESARSLDHLYYEHMQQGFRVLTDEQAARLMDAYEEEELRRFPAYVVPTRRRA